MGFSFQFNCGAAERHIDGSSRATLATVLLIGVAHAGLVLAVQMAPPPPPRIVPPQPMAVRWIEAPPSPPQVTERPKPQAVKPPPVPKPVPAPRERIVQRPALAPATSVEDASPTPVPAQAIPARIEPGEAPPPPPPVVTPPRVDAAYLANPAPEYPSAALRAKQQGQVLLRVLVGADGHVREVKVERGCGFALLDAAALAAVSRWTFTPGHRGTVAVEDWVLVPIQFKLRS